MKVVIPMAGYGTRLRPHTWSKPKPLVTVAGKPVLGHVLDTVAGLPFVDEVIFTVGYLGEQVEEYVRQEYPGLRARYIEQRELLGQSHAVWLAREHLAGPMLMIFVDTLIEADLSRLAQEKAGAVAFVKAVPDPRRFGVAEVGPHGRVTRLVEKPQDAANNLAVVGLYYFADAAALLQAIEAQMARKTQLKGEYFLADAINILLAGGLEMRVEPVEVWMDCGTPESLLETNRFLLDHGRDNSAEAARRPHSTGLYRPDRRAAPGGHRAARHHRRRLRHREVDLAGLDRRCRVEHRRHDAGPVADRAGRPRRRPPPLAQRRRFVRSRLRLGIPRLPAGHL